MRLLIRISAGCLAAWLLASIAAGLWLLPDMLLHAPMPIRSDAHRQVVRQQLGSTWTHHAITGSQNTSLDIWHLHRPASRGVVIYLHGFGDDAWGTLGRAAELPEWDAIGFTFRGRDRHPNVPCTLGAWERNDVVAVVRWLEASGIPRPRILIAAWSMGAGTALLSLADLEQEGAPLAGSLLECPFQNLREAARNHIRGTLGWAETATRLAQRIGLWRAGRLASFDPKDVDPASAAAGLRTPLAFVTGEADAITPLAGVRSIAGSRADLTSVPGAGHCEASNRLPGGWGAWARVRIARWLPAT